MKRQRLGNSDIEISSIILGTWQADNKSWVGVEDRSIQLAIEAALESGITTFDTAEEYGNGHSERLLGKALKGKRNKAIILTKVFSDHLTYAAVIRACEQSLKNLETERIDLYQIHWPSGSWESELVPISETMKALVKLRTEGKIRAIGVSNFSLSQLEEAIKCGPIESVQSPYSLFWRHAEQEILPWCQSKGITFLSYSPLAQGFLVGRFDKGLKLPRQDNRAKSKLYDPRVFPFVIDSVKSMRELAQKKKVTLAQLALAWVISHSHTAAIVGARNAEQVLENSETSQIELSSEDVRILECSTEVVSVQFRNDPVPWFWNP